MPALAPRVWVPQAVAAELANGRALGHDLPDPTALPWMAVRRAASAAALPLAADLGPGEAEVLALALEDPQLLAVIDDGLARRIAAALGIRFTGTLGLLVDAKRKGLLPTVKPVLDRLDTLRFRVAPATRAAVLSMAGEAP